MDELDIAPHFIELYGANALFLFLVGFVGGLVSGFIGSGGAFVLTPAMMSLGVSGVVAVASNICHKFPKAMVGAIKRHKYGQVDIKLGLVMAAAAAVGVWIGADIQHRVHQAYGHAGSSLYVSTFFVIVLFIVGGFVAHDVLHMIRTGSRHVEEERASRLARWIQSVEIPGTMMYFKIAKVRVSFLRCAPGRAKRGRVVRGSRASRGVKPLWASVSRAPEARAARPQGDRGLRSRSTRRARERERDLDVLSRLSRAGAPGSYCPWVSQPACWPRPSPSAASSVYPA